MELGKVEEKINYYAKRIIERGDKADEHALGELTFYMAFRRVLEGKATIQDVGMLDAINDTLQESGIISEQDTFYKMNKK
jgi:hypothetical protein